MMYTLLLALCFVALAFVLMAIKIILVKGGKFPNIHISGNKALRKKGITCAVSTDARDRATRGLKERITEE